MSWWFVALALASPPDSAPALIDAGEGSVGNLAVSSDGRLVVAIDGSAVSMLSTADWSVAQASPCNAQAAVPGGFDDAGIDVWVACDDGTLVILDWANGTVDAEPVATYEVATAGFLDVWWHADTSTVWALAEPEDTTTPTLHSVDVTTDEIDAEGTISTWYQSYEDGSLVGDYLYVAHGNEQVTRIGVVAGTSVPDIDVLSFSVVDVAASPRGGVYGADSGGRLIEFDPTDLRWDSLVLDLGTLGAVGSSLDEQEPWVLVAGGGTARVWALSDTGTLGETSTTFDVPATLVDVVSGPDGYAYGGTSDGVIAVLTANPWVEDVVATPSAGTLGTEITLSFTVDEGVDWEIRRGGATADDGTWLAEGETAAGTVTVPLVIDDGWAEGDNTLWVVASDAQNNDGHAATSVSVDNPPGAVALTDANLGFGDGYMVLSFDGLSDEDLDHYDIYVTTTPFRPEDWPTGGPAFDGDDALEAPIEVAASEHVTVTLSPLTNDVTYYVAVRATDAGGLEGPMSDVISEMPRETFSAAELAGESGGCSTLPGLAGAWPVLLALFGVLAARPAHAQEDEKGPERDLTPTHGNFELRYGGIQLEDASMKAVYGSTGNNLLFIEAGPQFFRVLELDVSIGLFQELDWTLDESGSPSSERTMMSWLPLGLDATLRGQLIDEQILVPHARFGFDYLPWREEWDDGAGGKEKIGGNKRGTHYAFGAGLLLDTFAPARASLLEAQSGVNDTFLIAEWRRQNITDGQGLDFSGTSVTFGIKLDY